MLRRTTISAPNKVNVAKKAARNHTPGVANHGQHRRIYYTIQYGYLQKILFLLCFSFSNFPTGAWNKRQQTKRTRANSPSGTSSIPRFYRRLRKHHTIYDIPFKTGLETRLKWITYDKKTGKKSKNVPFDYWLASLRANRRA